jgi:hypothetical protein
MAELDIEQFKTITSQNNRITSHPIFFVQDTFRIYGEPDRDDFYGIDEAVWVYAETNEEATPSQTRALNRMAHSRVFSVPAGWVRVPYIEFTQNIQPFFTEVGAQAYIDANRHNLHSPSIYVASAWRNLEWRALREYLIARVYECGDCEHQFEKPEQMTEEAFLAYWDAREAPEEL